MADIVVEAAMLNGQARAMNALVFVSSTVGYMFGINGDSDLDYMKTTNGGLTWGAAVDVFTGSVDSFGIWYDQWTPGDTGRIIHIAYTENGTDDVQYEQLNTVNDVQSTLVDVRAGTTATLARGVFTSITKARGGNLYVAFDQNAGTELGLYRSTDNGATWGVRTNPMEATIDQCMLFPANAADPNDIWMLYQDASTDGLTVKTHDDSANTNSESSALTMAENTFDFVGQYGFAGSIRHSDGNLIFAYMSTYDAAGGSTTNFNVYQWDGTTLTALTAIASAVDHIYYPGVYLNQDQPDWIYVAHLGVSAGTSTLTTSMPIVYSLSKDRGVTWTKDIAYSTVTSDYRQCWVPLNGERFMIVWTDISALSLNTNNDNSKEFGFTALNNYMIGRATGQNNTGILSTFGDGIK